jgi:hypothetical protein
MSHPDYITVLKVHMTYSAAMKFEQFKNVFSFIKFTICTDIVCNPEPTFFINLYHKGTGDLIPVLWACWPDFSSRIYSLAIC